jgi:hypothetical protein
MEQGLQTKLPLYTPPHSILKEVNGYMITFREEYGVIKHPPKSKRRIIGEPTDILVDRPVRVIKPSRLVKSPFMCKQHTNTRSNTKAADDLYKYTVSIHDKNFLK